MKAFALAVIALVLSVSASLAVDPTISPYCRGEEAKNHKLFCETISSNKSLGTQSSGPDACDPNSPLYDGPCPI